MSINTKLLIKNLPGTFLDRINNFHTDLRIPQVITNNKSKTLYKSRLK